MMAQGAGIKYMLLASVLCVEPALLSVSLRLILATW